MWWFPGWAEKLSTRVTLRLNRRLSFPPQLARWSIMCARHLTLQEHSCALAGVSGCRSAVSGSSPQMPALAALPPWQGPEGPPASSREPACTSALPEWWGTKAEPSKTSVWEALKRTGLTMSYNIWPAASAAAARWAPGMRSCPKDTLAFTLNEAPFGWVVTPCPRGRSVLRNSPKLSE